jgi:hypothetical protein
MQQQQQQQAVKDTVPMNALRDAFSKLQASFEEIAKVLDDGEKAIEAPVTPVVDALDILDAKHISSFKEMDAINYRMVNQKAVAERYKPRIVSIPEKIPMNRQDDGKYIAVLGKKGNVRATGTNRFKLYIENMPEHCNWELKVTISAAVGTFRSQIFISKCITGTLGSYSPATSFTSNYRPLVFAETLEPDLYVLPLNAGQVEYNVTIEPAVNSPIIPAEVNFKLGVDYIFNLDVTPTSTFVTDGRHVDFVRPFVLKATGVSMGNITLPFELKAPCASICITIANPKNEIVASSIQLVSNQNNVILMEWKSEIGGNLTRRFDHTGIYDVYDVAFGSHMTDISQGALLLSHLADCQLRINFMEAPKKTFEYAIYAYTYRVLTCDKNDVSFKFTC